MSEQTAEAPSSSILKRTPLYDLNLRLGARMVAFAGYDMPVQFTPGILQEHLHTRRAAGLFDVSHMGQIALRAKSGLAANAAKALERLVPVDIVGLAPGRQRYGFFTNEDGGLLDDLMIANRGDHLLVVVNAACKAADTAHLAAHLSDDCRIEPLERALLAIQGPASEAALAALAPECAAMAFMDVREADIVGARCVVSRSGYTGEDGFEISVPAEAAQSVAEALLARPGVMPIGLGARDSLRLEAGLCLYGTDIDATTTPAEAGLGWAMGKTRRSGGVRAGGFPGAGRILRELDAGPSRRRIGPLRRRPGARAGWRAAVCRSRPAGADRDRDLGRVWSERRWACRHGVRAGGARGTRNPTVRRGAGEAAAGSGRSTSVRSSCLQTRLSRQTPG